MSNPFPANFDSQCQDCGDTVAEGDNMFAHEGKFICDICAASSDLVCSGGQYKKEEYKTCYTCHEENEEEEDEEEPPRGTPWAGGEIIQ